MRHTALALCLSALASTLAPPALADNVDCGERRGIDLARCQRHQKMAAHCGKVTGEAHFACDREFLLAQPLDCKALPADAQSACQAELDAFKVCKPKPGAEFMRCVRDTTKVSPVGH